MTTTTLYELIDNATQQATLVRYHGKSTVDLEGQPDEPVYLLSLADDEDQTRFAISSKDFADNFTVAKVQGGS